MTDAIAPIETARLTLIPADPELLITLLERPAEFTGAVGFPAGPGLREFFGGAEVSPAWLAALREAKGADPWRHGFLLKHREHGMAVGTAGFKGPADADGVVEIAYGVIPTFEGQGLASEAAAALVKFALATPGVKEIRAHTLPETNASTRVLKRAGFEFESEVDDPEDGRVWRWRWRG